MIGEGAAAIAAFTRYRGTVLPAVRRELTGWRQAAASIPDPILRQQAVEAVTTKAANAEATAVLAILAPRRSRRTVVRASVALQVIVDYLDSLGEQPGSEDPLRDGLRLHSALGAALQPGSAGGDWYALHPRQQDGGYIDRLIAVCRESASSLPSAEMILPFARRAAIRCGEGQSHTHAAAASGVDQALRQWSSELATSEGYEWWEVAAGACSSVAAHALLALAGAPWATAGQAAAVDASYFPSIGALTVLLDDLVDRELDLAAGEHSYLRHYSSDAAAAERLERVANFARGEISRMPDPAPHQAILSGILAFYLSDPGAAAPGARRIRDQLLQASGPVTRALTRVVSVDG